MEKIDWRERYEDFIDEYNWISPVVVNTNERLVILSVEDLRDFVQQELDRVREEGSEARINTWIMKTFPFMSRKEQRALSNIIELYVDENS